MGSQRSHVPYRNSMMTQVLRDSLGGNCRTVMIANITAQHEQLDESISTCRFAQRVAMISNQVCTLHHTTVSCILNISFSSWASPSSPTELLHMWPRSPTRLAVCNSQHLW